MLFPGELRGVKSAPIESTLRGSIPGTSSAVVRRSVPKSNKDFASFWNSSMEAPIPSVWKLDLAPCVREGYSLLCLPHSTGIFGLLFLCLSGAGGKFCEHSVITNCWVWVFSLCFVRIHFPVVEWNFWNPVVKTTHYRVSSLKFVSKKTNVINLPTELGKIVYNSNFVLLMFVAAELNNWYFITVLGTVTCLFRLPDFSADVVQKKERVQWSAQKVKSL